MPSFADKQTERQMTERLFSFLIKTKVVQNVNRMTERHADRQSDRRTERQIARRQNNCLAYLSKQKLFRMSTGCQKDRKTGGQTSK